MIIVSNVKPPAKAANFFIITKLQEEIDLWSMEMKIDTKVFFINEKFDTGKDMEVRKIMIQKETSGDLIYITKTFKQYCEDWPDDQKTPLVTTKFEIFIKD
jgi:hypothetical protein